MSSLEIGKWIELWLDRAGERVYQPAFVSALAHQGYIILHNTSHNALEFGKDVIALSPEGELVAFQLKGNPNSRFTVSQWHGLYEQVVQLTSMPVPEIISGRKAMQHTPILVTNGEVEESVQAAITHFNNDRVPLLGKSRPLKLWSRGRLVELFSKVAMSVWPSPLETQIKLLHSITTDARYSANMEDVQSICADTLKWADVNASSNRALDRMAGLSTLLYIFVSPFLKINNRFEAIKIMSVGVGMMAGYMDRCQSTAAPHRRIYDLARSQLFEMVRSFATDVSDEYGEHPMINENIFHEFGVFNARKILVTALLAVATLEYRDIDIKVKAIVKRPIDYPFIISEGVITAFLAVFWAKDAIDGTRENEIELISVMSNLVKAAKGPRNIPSSYYSLEECVLSEYRVYLGRQWHDLDRDERILMSQFSYTLLCMIAKRNWKTTAKSYWPDITRIIRQETQIHHSEEFAFYRTQNAKHRSLFVKTPETWASLTEALGAKSVPDIPSALKNDPVLCVLILVFLPFRGTKDLILWLDRALCKTWY